MQWRIQLFGGLCARRDDQAVSRFRTQKTGTLLAYLALYHQRSHLREHLIDLLWPEGDPVAGRNSLSVALSSLRHQFEPPGVPAGTFLIADRTSVRLNADAISLDVDEFESALRTASLAPSPPDAIPLYAQAAEIYRGELLSGYYEDWIFRDQERLSGLYLHALQKLIAQYEQDGEYSKALDYAHRALLSDPYHEEMHQRIMRLHAAVGHPSTALRHFREMERLFEQELESKPSATTRQLAEEIERVDSQPSPVALPLLPVKKEPELELPTGTVTLLLADEGENPAEASETSPSPSEGSLILLRDAARQYGGVTVRTDSPALVAFERASDALACAVSIQRGVASALTTGEEGNVPLRIALETGEIELSEGAYAGPILSHSLELLRAAHGGQVLCSEATVVLLKRDLDTNVQLEDLGIYRLRHHEIPERLFNVDYPECPQKPFPPPRAEAAYSDNLPLQFTRFIGRQDELERLEPLLADEERNARLVTLTGPGGCGKTRLSLEAARRVVPHFRGAVWFVSLSDLTDHRLIPDAIRDALQLARSPVMEALDQVAEAVSRQPTLLVLDNFEQLVDGGAPILRRLLEAAPSVRCLVSSRHLLGLSGEHDFPVPPLPLPQGGQSPAHLLDSESVQLFVDRATTVNPEFRLTDANIADIAELCRRLEGIPLAIELAAARVQVLTPSQMLAHLSRRFDLLVSRKRDTTARHRTLWAAIEWNYQLLSPELQRFFTRLSVFRGGCTLEAAERVCDDPLALDDLMQLRECSLLRGEEENGEIRFRMLETLREFGAKKQEEFGETEAFRQRHFDHFFQLAAASEWELSGEEPEPWLRRLDAELDNFRIALEWGLETQPERTLEMAGILANYWFIRGYWSEGQGNLDKALEKATGADAQNRTKVLRWNSILTLPQGDCDRARELLEEALETGRGLVDQEFVAAVLGSLGSLEGQLGHYEKALALLDESLSIRREIGAEWGTAAVLSKIGQVKCAQGFAEQGEAFLVEGLEHFRKIGSKNGVAWACFNLGEAVFNQGQCESARQLYEESMALNQEIGDKLGIGFSLKGLGDVSFAQGDLETAEGHYRECLKLRREVGDRMGIVGVLEGMAKIAHASKEASQAAHLIGASEALRELVQTPLPPSEKASLEWCVEQVAASLGEAFEPERRKGRRLNWQQATAYALRESDPIRENDERRITLYLEEPFNLTSTPLT